MGYPRWVRFQVPCVLESSGRQPESFRQGSLVTVMQASLWDGTYGHCLELQAQMTSYLRLKMTNFHLFTVLDEEAEIKVSAELAPSKGPREKSSRLPIPSRPGDCSAPCVVPVSTHLTTVPSLAVPSPAQPHFDEPHMPRACFQVLS